MAQSSKATARLLDKTELDLVARTQRGAIGALPDDELRDLAAKLRERRDKARDGARRQKREMRGKAEPKGAKPASDNSGTKAKADALTAALKRVGAERTRRAEKEKAPSQRSLARKALALKQRQSAAQRPASRTAGKGMRPVENPKAVKSGALNDAGARPAMMRSKIARQS
ncbi:hypothetical protein IED13_23695 [Bosea sp. SSUT16]|uniref:Uncharacterized protein n=1 Tax=Bosea spartocytisi TaxID=2773451 RepID=A0A927I2E1_9HYPH|nr:MULTISPECIES: hypothetical protein [Bosea]MBD3848711.1 hypothetical protein [Bosea spartocytisi]MCT4473829.1 hypothetical protein [Bosea spartocytisi]